MEVSQTSTDAPVRSVSHRSDLVHDLRNSPLRAQTRETALILTEHDYRTARRANMHPIADALVRLGYDVVFVSIRFSWLSRWKGDSRLFLWGRANAPEIHNHVQCYLWKTVFHPFNPRTPALNGLTTLLYRNYALIPDRFIDQAIRKSSFIIVESGLGALLLRRIRAVNPAARVTYLASDELLTVGVHPFVQTQLEGSGTAVDHVCLPSRQMASGFGWAHDQLFFVPHGLDTTDFGAAADSPYASPLNAVSVGSMLFDSTAIIEAATRFPAMQFHVIGAGAPFDAPRNVRLYGEMPFRQTIPYIRHASIGLAPYRTAPGCRYLSDTSMKLMQYEHLGIPAVCPSFAAGHNPNRFGYTPGDAPSIERAISAALHGRDGMVPRHFLNWDDVARRLLDPCAFPDTAM